MSTQPKPEWAERLSRVLDEWCKNHRYFTKSRLGAELNIPKVIWGRISSGASVVNDVENYAKLWLRTDLQEANPETIPSYNRPVPSGRSVEVARAWKSGELNKWLKSPEADRIRKLKADAEAETKSRPEPIVAAQPPAVPTKEVVSAGQTIGSMLDGIIAVFARQMAEQMGDTIASKIASAIADQLTPLMEQLTQQQPPPREVVTADKPELPPAETKAKKGENLDAGQLANGLKLLLSHGTEEDREKVYRRYKNQLFDLLPILDAYTSFDSNEREARLRLIPK